MLIRSSHPGEETAIYLFYTVGPGVGKCLSVKGWRGNILGFASYPTRSQPLDFAALAESSRCQSCVF